MRTVPFSTSIPFDDSWDVIVCGGGPAGCASAAAAARDGAKTLLLESTGSLGGMGTSGLVPAWAPFSDNEKIIYRGLAQKVFEECKAGMPQIPKNALDWVPIDPERLKQVYDDLVTIHGGTVQFFSTVCHVEQTDRAINHIVVASKTGLTAFKSKVFVDCTGDADLCAWAGAEFHKGNSQGKNLMPATHCFILANVDEEAYRNGPSLHPGNPNSPMYKILRSGKYPLIPDAHMCSNLIGPGVVGFNAGHLWDVDNTQPETVSKAIIHGRKMAQQFRYALAEFVPAAFGNAFLVSTGSLMGIRETRRIVGDYVLTLKDYLERRTFPDEICRNAYFIDIHQAQEEAMQHPEDYGIWDKQIGFRYGPGESHGIPYRCLIPKALDNVLVAGRSISCEQAVQGSIRVMPVCLAMGEAAGIAAAQTCNSGSEDVRNVATCDLRARLREFGAFLP